MLLISFLGKDNKDKRYDVVLVRSLGKLVQVRMSKTIQLRQSQKNPVFFQFQTMLLEQYSSRFIVIFSSKFML